MYGEEAHLPASASRSPPWSVQYRILPGQGPTGPRTASSGGGGIRTHGALSGPATFKVAAFGRSATPPGRSVGVRRGGQAVSGGGCVASRWLVEVGGGGGGPGRRGGRCRPRPS